MALLWIEGFESFGQSAGSAPDASIGQKYTAGSSGTMRLLAGRDSGMSLELSTATESLNVGVGQQATLVVGFAFKFTSSFGFPAVPLVLRDGTTQNVRILIDTDHKLSLQRGGSALAGPGTTVLQPDTWYYLEPKVTTHDTTGAYELRIDTVTELSASGVDTKAGSSNFCDNALLAGDNGSAYEFDDWYIDDSTFRGDCKVEIIDPNADGDDTAWTPDTGTDHFARVDDAGTVDGDTSYVEGDTAGERDLFNYESASGTIHGIQLNTHARVTAGSETLKQPIKSGTTLSNDAGQTVASTSYDHFARISEQDPDTAAAWTGSGVSAAQFGVEVG